MTRAPIGIDDLPRHSPWPARLLGLEAWQQRKKTPEELTREYEGEKWGPLLAHLRQVSDVTLDAANARFFDGQHETVALVDGRLQLLTQLDFHRAYVDYVATTLAGYLPAAALVELGAGYGAVVLAMASRAAFSRLAIAAAEYAKSGVELLRLIARAEGRSVAVEQCDFSRMDDASLPIAPGALVFTSFATMAVPNLGPMFVEAIRRRGPGFVVHFEPLYEHCEEASLLGLMRRRYIEVNDYNRNLLTLLKDQHAAGNIELIEERRPTMGNNAFLAASVLVWRPR